MRIVLVTILNKTLKFKSFPFEKSKFGKKIKKQGQRQRQPTIEIQIEIEKRYKNHGYGYGI